ncbi:uncharacterized protein LOC120005380 [Tripterygium wilfordii]|uniref:uncharacterized protein LOC120005380 n=1 Tax=Tripterygium wilfordii TaxID=458696 RepID=UPI0018F7F899|nr:uncharacterized protein LOC120005380 [Tripterygium wilfordii]
MSNEPKSYLVIIDRNVIKFSTLDICELIEFPRAFVHNTYFEPAYVTSCIEMIMALSTDPYTGHSTVRRVALPYLMRLLDTVVKKNLVPVGHDQGTPEFYSLWEHRSTYHD